MYMLDYVSVHTWYVEGQRKIYGSPLSPSIMWSCGFELKLSALPASTLTQ